MLYLCSMKTALYSIVFVLALICGYSNAWDGLFKVMKPSNGTTLDSLKHVLKCDSITLQLSKTKLIDLDSFKQDHFK